MIPACVQMNTVCVSSMNVHTQWSPLRQGVTKNHHPRASGGGMPQRSLPICQPASTRQSSMLRMSLSHGDGAHRKWAATASMPTIGHQASGIQEPGTTIGESTGYGPLKSGSRWNCSVTGAEWESQRGRLTISCQNVRLGKGRSPIARRYTRLSNLHSWISRSHSLLELSAFGSGVWTCPILLAPREILYFFDKFAKFDHFWKKLCGTA